LKNTAAAYFGSWNQENYLPHLASFHKVTTTTRSLTYKAHFIAASNV
jgi:hypothetical protein